MSFGIEDALRKRRKSCFERGPCGHACRSRSRERSERFFFRQESLHYAQFRFEGARTFCGARKIRERKPERRARSRIRIFGFLFERNDTPFHFLDFGCKRSETKIERLYQRIERTDLVAD